MARARRGAWFDPALVDSLCAFEHDDDVLGLARAPRVAALGAGDRVETVDQARLDRVAEAFADGGRRQVAVHGRHSEGVARDRGRARGYLLGLDEPHAARPLRAGLLHDIGKLGVSNRILDKRGGLDADEWHEVRRHPLTSLQILQRVGALRNVPAVGLHHERLDGSGYYLGFDGTQLDLPARVLAVADVAEALSAQRPYRDALAPDEVLEIMSREAGTTLDAEAFEALVTLMTDQARPSAARRPRPALPKHLERQRPGGWIDKAAHTPGVPGVQSTCLSRRSAIAPQPTGLSGSTSPRPGPRGMPCWVRARRAGPCCSLYRARAGPVEWLCSS